VQSLCFGTALVVNERDPGALPKKMGSWQGLILEEAISASHSLIFMGMSQEGGIRPRRRLLRLRW